MALQTKQEKRTKTGKKVLKPGKHAMNAQQALCKVSGRLLQILAEANSAKEHKEHVHELQVTEELAPLQGFFQKTNEIPWFAIVLALLRSQSRIQTPKARKLTKIISFKAREK